MYDVNKMYTYLRGYLTGANMLESIKALQFMRDKHNGQTRKDNTTPYIIHPLEMACYAINLGIKDDNIIATILLHDVIEDCGIEENWLPVNDTIKYAVRHMTIKSMNTDMDKIETKCRYFNELLDSKEALICKALDRYNNLSTMSGTMTDDAIGKNLAETEILFLPLLRDAKYKYIELSSILFVLRTNIQTLVDALKPHYTVEYIKWKDKYNRK